MNPPKGAGARCPVPRECLRSLGRVLNPAATLVDQAALAAQIIDTLSSEHAVGSEKRKHTRYKWNVVVSVSLEEDNGVRIRSREFKAVLIDISIGGLAFMYGQDIVAGTFIHTRFDTLANKPVLRGTVRNCIKLDQIFYRVGVQTSD